MLLWLTIIVGSMLTVLAVTANIEGTLQLIERVNRTLRRLDRRTRKMIMDTRLSGVAIPVPSGARQGEYLAAARRAAGLSRIEMATALGVGTTKAIEAAESGQEVPMSLATWQRIADVFGRSLRTVPLDDTGLRYGVYFT